MINLVRTRFRASSSQPISSLFIQYFQTMYPIRCFADRELKNDVIHSLLLLHIDEEASPDLCILARKRPNHVRSRSSLTNRSRSKDSSAGLATGFHMKSLSLKVELFDTWSIQRAIPCQTSSTESRLHKNLP